MRDTWFDPTAPSRQVSRQRERLATKGRNDAPPKRSTVTRHTTRFWGGPGKRERLKGARAVAKEDTGLKRFLHAPA